MEYTQRVATTSGGGEVFLLDDDRLVLGLGPVLLPMTHRSLSGLANTLLRLAKQPESFHHQERIFVSCGRLTLRLTHVEFQDLLSLVGKTLTWLDARPLLRGDQNTTQLIS